MSDDKKENDFINIHGFKLRKGYEESSTLKELVHEWKHNSTAEKLDKDVFKGARHASTSDGFNLDDEKTAVIHHSDGSYSLRRRR